ncbi:hypothetical protein Lnau_2568 [Legionella nautarum]|uniref:Uncharacterized protein n=2 Tax=Legionella nautarum TaxID=45070 RepID=A0A0W0WKS9_9GAMM|nr:hypothetical protein Lnau_2568 [Legionella nautarum]
MVNLKVVQYNANLINHRPEMREKSIHEIQKLGNEAYNPIGLQHYDAGRHEWNGIGISGDSGSYKVKMAITSLKKGKIDPIFALIKDIDKYVSYYEKQLPNFFEALYSYTNFLYARYGNNIPSYHPAPELILKSHIRGISRLKEISASLKEKMVFSPTREFEKTLEKNDSETGVSPQSPTLASNPELLKMIKNHAGTYQMNSSPQSESASFNEIQRLFLEAYYEVQIASTNTLRPIKTLREKTGVPLIKKGMSQLKEGNLDPLLSLLRQIDAEVDEAAKFVASDDYEQASRMIKLHTLGELEQINQS